jgi:serine/threonine protein kinase
MADARPSVPLGQLLSTGDDLLDFWQLRAHFENIEGATFTEHHRLFSDSSRQIRNQLEIKRWKRERELGRGGFGTVYLEQDTEGQLRAVKIVQRRTDKKVVEYLREVLAMANLSRVSHGRSKSHR